MQNSDESDEGEHQEDNEMLNKEGDSDMESDQDDESNPQKRLSKKKFKKLAQMTVAQLKQFAPRPEVVEWEDVTAKDPKLLVLLKSVRCSVPVPQHWSRKRKYLAGKRGYVKPPFELPQFIKDTGIMEMRDGARQEDANKRQKTKAREKMHPKLGRITVDYEKLHDAFFKYQTKPLLSGYGDLYYEGREFEGRSRDARPGYLSEELRTALGMTLLSPPPWIHNIQKYGPPPAYPHMRIPGYNAPIPEGAQWGFHQGGWGKPPMDTAIYTATETNKADTALISRMLNLVDKNIWGELEPDAEGESYDIEPEFEMVDQVHEMTLDEDQAESFYYENQQTRHRDATIAKPEIEPVGPESIESSRRSRRR